MPTNLDVKPKAVLSALNNAAVRLAVENLKPIPGVPSHGCIITSGDGALEIESGDAGSWLEANQVSPIGRKTFSPGLAATGGESAGAGRQIKTWRSQQ